MRRVFSCEFGQFRVNSKVIDTSSNGATAENLRGIHEGASRSQAAECPYD